MILKRKRKLVALLLLSYRRCSVAPPHFVVGWPAVCDGGISRSYSLPFSFFIAMVFSV